MIIDVHAHAFPDHLAQRAVSTLAGQTGMHQPVMDGTIATLLKSMDECGITRAFIASIATKPQQNSAILSWSQSIRSERILPLGSVHPWSELWERDLERVAESGLVGVKLHPLYQAFEVDDESLLPFYEKIARLELIVLVHAGYDLAFPRDDRAAPKRIGRVHRRVPNLTMIAAHLGGWKAWSDVESCLVGTDVYFDTSFMHDALLSQQERILRNHPTTRILFGSDSPWFAQSKSLEYVRGLGLTSADLEKILRRNAEALLKSKCLPRSLAHPGDASVVVSGCVSGR